MDKLDQYRQIIQSLLTEYVKTPIANGEIEPIWFLMFCEIIIK